MANAWNELNWGVGDYGEQNNSTVPLTSGVSSSSSIGTITLETEQRIEITGLSLSVNLGESLEEIIDDGWGAQLWGYGAWGIKGDVLLSGQELSTFINNVTLSISAEVDVIGISLQSSAGQSSSRIDAEAFPEGLSLQMSIGDEGTEANAIVTPTSILLSTTTGQSTIDPSYLIGEGWGRDTYGNLGWGVNYSAIGGGVNGLSLSVISGDEDAFTDYTQVIEGLELDTAITPVGTSGTSDNEIAHSFLIQTVLEDVSIEGHANVYPTGIGSSVSIGEAIGGTIQEVPVTGVSATLSIGDEDQSGSAVVIPTGVTSTMALGDSIPESKYAVTGVSASLTAGQTTVVGSAVVIPTGVGLTISTVTPNIIAWAEVDTGTPVNWTAVDLAA